MSDVSAAELAAVVAYVVDDTDLHRRLLAVRDPQEFVADVVAVAHEIGLSVSAEDVHEGLRAAREWWLMRWV